MAYVTTADRVPGCVLCRARDGADGAERLVVHRGELNFVVMNLFPYNGGHVMVAPARHVGSLAEATADACAVNFFNFAAVEIGCQVSEHVAGYKKVVA